MDYPEVDSQIYYLWSCPVCFKLNYVSPDSHDFYGGLNECMKCETAYIVKKPSE